MSEAPFLRLVRGDATAEELAALVAVLSTRGGQGVDEAVTERPLWARPRLRGPLPHGPGAWRASGLPG